MRSAPFSGQEGFMDDHIYRVIEIVGTSKTGVDDAIRTAIGRAGENSVNPPSRWPV
jgi:hypothetical protein